MRTVFDKAVQSLLNNDFEIIQVGIEFFTQLMYLFYLDYSAKDDLIERTSLVSLVCSVMQRNNLSNQGLCNLLELLNAMLVKECSEETALNDETYGGYHEDAGQIAYEVAMVSKRAY